MVLPRNTRKRQAILRRVLDGQAVVYPVQVYAFMGGRVQDFHTVVERRMVHDLVALGYQPRDRPHFNSLLRTVWVHDEPDFLEPMPMPELEIEADCVGPERIRTARQIMADVERHLDEFFGKESC